jgi:hypothetical protein
MCTSSEVVEHEEGEVDQRANNPKTIEEEARKEVDYSKCFSLWISKDWGFD